MRSTTIASRRRSRGRAASKRAYDGVGPAGLAQLVEHLICNQGVTGSNPVGGTSNINALDDDRLVACQLSKHIASTRGGTAVGEGYVLSEVLNDAATFFFCGGVVWR